MICVLFTNKLDSNDLFDYMLDCTSSQVGQKNIEIKKTTLIM